VQEEQLRIAKIKMESLESVYNNNLEMLRDTVSRTKQENRRTRVDQKSIMIDLERELKKDR
jgi:hypothetical protein